MSAAPQDREPRPHVYPNRKLEKRMKNVTFFHDACDPAQQHLPGRKSCRHPGPELVGGVLPGESHQPRRVGGDCWVGICVRSTRQSRKHRAVSWPTFWDRKTYLSSLTAYCLKDRLVRNRPGRRPLVPALTDCQRGVPGPYHKRKHRKKLHKVKCNRSTQSQPYAEVKEINGKG